MKPVFIGYKAPVSESRVAEFIKGEMDANDLTVFMQDMIEADLVPWMQVNFRSDFADYARYYVEQGLCHITGRALH